MSCSDKTLALMWAMENWDKIDKCGYVDLPCECCCYVTYKEHRKKHEALNVKRQEEMEKAAKAVEAEKAQKASKKKLKKVKQKEKRNIAKQQAEEAKETKSIKAGVKKIEPKEKPGSVENDPVIEDEKNQEIEAKSDTDEYETDQDESNDSEIDITNVDAIAFLKSSVKKDTSKIRKKSVTENVRVKDSVKSNNVSQNNKMQSTDTDPYLSTQKVAKKSEELGNQALKMIRIDQFKVAVDLLTKAIDLDFNDARHYINRSYCYLRLGNFTQALEDIEFASKHFSDAAEIAKAKCRKGQAFNGLNKYEDAEQAFRECLELIPNCPYAKRELKRVQIKQIVNSGFKEHDAIMALEEKENTTEAIIRLSGEKTIETDSDNGPDYTIDDEVYYSDDEGTPSNETILSILLDFDPSSPVTEQPIQPQINEPVNNNVPPLMDFKSFRELKVIKTVKSVVPNNNQLNNDMSVWFGDMNGNASEAMLKKAFAKYGKISSIHRDPKGYGFVNFVYPGCAKKALDDATANGGNIDVNGINIPVKRKR